MRYRLSTQKKKRVARSGQARSYVVGHDTAAWHIPRFGRRRYDAGRDYLPVGRVMRDATGMKNGNEYGGSALGECA
jgi:hypothetical protein